jgi:HPt (histidine-containing phosphotransfer) domain-containing protein
MENKMYDSKLAAHELNLDERVVKQVALEFAGSYRLYLDPIIRAVDDHDREEAARQAHRLKGAALELRLHHIAELAAQLEKCAGKDITDQAPALIIRLTDCFNLLKQELEDGA